MIHLTIWSKKCLSRPHTYWTRTHLKKHHHLETIYWTFATRYQLNTELSCLSLHPPRAGTGSTSLHWEEGMLQDLVRRTLCWKSFGFLSSDNKRETKSKSASQMSKKTAASPLSAARSCAYRQWQNDTNMSREEKSSIDNWDTPLTERRPGCVAMIWKAKSKMINMNILEKKNGK